MEHPIMFDEDDPVLAELRARALPLPGVVETITFGRPWWTLELGAKPISGLRRDASPEARLGPRPRGRAFAVYGGATKGPERVVHPRALLAAIDPEELPARRQDPRFFVPAYFGPRGWLGIDLDGADVDWDEVAELLDAAFRTVAPRSLVAELDARG